MNEITRSVQVRYDDVPVEVEGWIAGYLDEVLLLCPGWVEEFSVEYKGESTDYMSMRAVYRYRSATLTLTGQSVAQTPTERANTLRHEMIHVLMAPIEHIISDVIEALEESQRKLIIARVKEAYEASTEDIARAIGRVIASHNESGMMKTKKPFEPIIETGGA